jgi:Zn-dependent metalloprotease
MKRLVILAAVLMSVTLMAQGQDARATALRLAQSFTSARLASLPAGSTLQAGDVVVDDIGQAHVRFQHLYQGVPVFESEAIVHVDLRRGSVIDATDALLSFGTIASRPGIGGDEARGRARGHFGLAQGHTERNDLMVMVDESGGWLTWRVRISGDDARGRVDKIAFIDAFGGQVHRSWDNLETAASTGSGTGFFSGVVSLTTDTLSATSWRLRDPSRGSQFTCDMKNRQSLCYYMDDANNVWGDGTLTNRQSVAVDAQYGTAKTWDYYKNVHGRNGIANNGAGAYNRVHYGNRYNNAFWSDSCFCMTYGDGDGTTFNPFDSLDVAGHEMSHGVTSRTAKLTYSGESGGLNEATSDIFGTMVEYYTNNTNDKPDYQIGEKLYKSGTKALRYMYLPSLDGKSADCWYAGVGSLDVHYSSGIANHFYYLLAEGTTNSRTCNTTSSAGRVATGTNTLSGIGRADAEKIWYRALTTYMTSSTNHAGARAATLNAASDLFGTGSAQRAAAAAAWSAVNVN